MFDFLEERKVICAMLLKYGDLNEKHMLNQTRSSEEVNFAIKTEYISKTEEGLVPRMFHGKLIQNFCNNTYFISIVFLKSKPFTYNSTIEILS